MKDFIERLASGLPLTFIGGLALIVVLAWLFGGARPQPKRRALAAVWLVLLLGSWGALLYSEPSAQTTKTLLWVTLAVTAISFFLPMLWNRIHAKNNNT